MSRACKRLQPSLACNGHVANAWGGKRAYSMDFSGSDVAVRHAIAVSQVHVSHSLDISPSAVSIAREIKICIIAVVVGLTTASIIKSAFLYKRSSE